MSWSWAHAALRGRPQAAEGRQQAVFGVQCSVCGRQSAAGSVQFPLCGVLCAVFSVRLVWRSGPESALSAVCAHWALLAAFCFLCSLQTGSSVQSAVCKVQCAKWPVKSAHRRLSGARSLASQPARRGPLSSPGRQPKWAASARPTASIGRLARPVETGTRRGEVRRRAGLVELGDGGDCGGDDCLLLAACCLAGWPAGRLLSGAQVH